MKSLSEIKVILFVLKIIFIALIIITITVLIYQIHYVICCCTQNSFSELAINKHFLKFLFIACFSVLTLYVAGKQLKKQTDVACVAALTELRKLLTSKNNGIVHLILSNKNEQKLLFEEEVRNESLQERELVIDKNIRLLDALNYLGTIELGVIMVKRNLIDWDTFYSQFGYRIENIFDEENNPVHIEVRKHINDNKSYYKNLLWANEEILKKIIK
ncbi:MAG: hypothetical protein FWF46_09590 [Oscillospiraceae bacterium]|nr:hypothetical protein [Oscillospiraceae bacterium]